MHKKFTDRIKSVKDKEALEYVKASVVLEVSDTPPIKSEGTAIVSVIMSNDGDAEVVVGGYMSPEDLGNMMSAMLDTINNEVIPNFEEESGDELH